MIHPNSEKIKTLIGKALSTRFIRNKNLQSAYEIQNGFYPYIPLPPETFCEHLYRARFLNKGAKTFVDVGCGFGHNLRIARDDFGYSVTGIEYNKDYVKSAIRRIGKKNIIHADARFLDYSSYDVVYMYCPIHDANVYTELFIQIVSTMKEGALLIEALPVHMHYMCAKHAQLFHMLHDRRIQVGPFFKKESDKLRIYPYLLFDNIRGTVGEESAVSNRNNILKYINYHINKIDALRPYYNSDSRITRLLCLRLAYLRNFEQKVAQL